MYKKLIKKLKAFRKYFVRRNLVRYEVMSLMTHIDYKDAKLKKAQDDGWEICGEILLKNNDGWCRSTYFHIPMRRRI